MPIGMPGWPELAAWTASIESARMALAVGARRAAAVMGLRSRPTTDVGALRRQLDAFVDELATIDASVNELTAERERLEAELADVDDDLVRRWQLDEQIADVKSQIASRMADRALPSTRAAQLRALLSPVIDREREVARRTLAIAHHEHLLEVHALTQRVGEALAEARRLGRQVPGGAEFSESMRRLDGIVSHWDATIAPQLRRRLADDRRFISAAEAESS